MLHTQRHKQPPYQHAQQGSDALVIFKDVNALLDYTHTYYAYMTKRPWLNHHFYQIQT